MNERNFVFYYYYIHTLLWTKVKFISKTIPSTVTTVAIFGMTTTTNNLIKCCLYVQLVVSKHIDKDLFMTTFTEMSI